MSSERWDEAGWIEAASAAARRLAGHVAAAEAGRGPAAAQPPPGEVARRLGLRRWIAEGGMDAPAFAAFLDEYLACGTNVHHPGALAHQVAAPDVGAALADLLHGVLNNPMSIYEYGAAAATIEHVVVEWMLGLVGWDPATSGGVLTHGGSLATLTALLAARARQVPEAWDDGVPGGLAVLAPPTAHYAVARAVSMMGLGARALIPLEVDDVERIRPERVGAGIAAARAAGRRPIALVAPACATSTGRFEDLPAIADVCAAEGVWLHVDGAHGASLLLAPAHRHRLAGIERADSVIWDAHKLLRTSSLCAAVLVRRGEDLTGAFQQEASYVFYDEGGPGIDILDRQVECTKAPIGVKLFLNLAWRGEQGLGEYVAGRVEMARRIHDAIAARPGFEVPAPPESNILLFRREGADDARQVEIRERLLADGDFHISSAVVAGRRWLRLVVTAPASDVAAAERLLDRIEALP